MVSNRDFCNCREAWVQLPPGVGSGPRAGFRARCDRTARIRLERQGCPAPVIDSFMGRCICRVRNTIRCALVWSLQKHQNPDQTRERIEAKIPFKASNSVQYSD